MSESTLTERMGALKAYVPYGAGYDRAVADEYHTALRLIREGRSEEAYYFVGLAEDVLERQGMARIIAASRYSETYNPWEGGK